MLESKLLLNRYISLPFFIGGRSDDSAPGFRRVASPPYYLRESTGFLTKSSNVIELEGPKAHRRFVWLPWIPGHISEITLLGADVITGPISGCKIATYRREGQLYVGHIGTLENQAKSSAIKALWKSSAQSDLSEVQVFDPARGIHNFARPRPRELAGPKIFCLVTVTRQAYAICAYEQGIGSGNYRIHEVNGLIPLSRDAV